MWIPWTWQRTTTTPRGEKRAAPVTSADVVLVAVLPGVSRHRRRLLLCGSRGLGSGRRRRPAPPAVTMDSAGIDAVALRDAYPSLLHGEHEVVFRHSVGSQEVPQGRVRVEDDPGCVCRLAAADLVENTEYVGPERDGKNNVIPCGGVDVCSQVWHALQVLAVGRPAPCPSGVRDHLEDESGEAAQLGLAHHNRFVALLRPIDLLPQASEFVQDMPGNEVCSR